MWPMNAAVSLKPKANTLAGIYFMPLCLVAFMPLLIRTLMQLNMSFKIPLKILQRALQWFHSAGRQCAKCIAGTEPLRVHLQ